MLGCLARFDAALFVGPNNKHVESGPYAHDHSDRIGKTHFAGLRAQPGTVWQARGLLPVRPGPMKSADNCSEFILKNILDHARDVLAQYDPSKGLPDPSFTLQLSDEVYSSSNLWAVQKLFEGPFQFDVYYESESAKHPLDGGPIHIDDG